MKPEEYQENAPGEVIRSPLGHWTFLPQPLPPALTYDSALVNRLSIADRALGELAGAGRMLPNPHLLIRPFLRREAVLSSRIEGTVTRLDQLFLFEAEPEHLSHPADADEVRNYVLAMEHGVAAVRQGVPFTLQLLRDLHRILMQNVRSKEKRPGEFRQQPVLIGRRYNFDEARFIPPCHTRLDPLLRDFVTFLQTAHDLPIVVQLALMHYQFETIHPFNDGNGRMGRLLITLMLCERGVLPQPLLYLSAYFEQHRQDYYDRLLAVSQKGDWYAWIDYFAIGVCEQARDASQRTRRLLELWQTYRLQASEAARSPNVLKLVDELFASPYITIKRAGEVMEIANKNATGIVQRMVDAGLLREVTGQQRYRVYCADRIFHLLDDELLADVSGKN